MKQHVLAGVLLGSLALAATAQAQDDYTVIGGGDPVDGSPKAMVVGGYMDMGMAHMVGDWDDAKVRFAGGGGAYFDFYVIPMLAIEGGIGFVGKGARQTEDYGPPVGDVEVKARLIYMEIPLGAKLNIMNFQASVLFALSFALSGKSTVEAEGDSSEHKWEGDDWDHWHRVNIGPKIVLGYAIPIGPVSLVPGFYWSMHMINEYKDIDSDDQIRAMNFMFRVAGEFGF